MITLKDIAKEAGVSYVTVSNVINGKDKKVSKAKREEILEIIKRNNYVPNSSARSLVSRVSKTVGVVVTNTGDKINFLANSANAELLGLLERNLRHAGYSMTFGCVSNSREIIRTIASWNASGIIIIGAWQRDIPMLRSMTGTPMLFIDALVDETITAACINTNDYRGGYLAAKYLIDKGHKRICFAGPGTESGGPVAKRFRGYASAMKKNDLEEFTRSHYIRVDDYEHGLEAGIRMAREGQLPTAILAASDLLALGIIEGLASCRIRVPADVSVVGFGDHPAGRFSVPRLTTVSQDLDFKAKRAAEVIVSLITGEGSEMLEEADVDVVERSSVLNR